MEQTVTLLEKREGTGVLTAVLDGKVLVEYHRSETGLGSLVGTVLLGQVERVLPDVKAAFVKIGRSKNGFLPLKESDSFHQLNGPAPLITGAAVPVQVRKDEKGDKGAFLSRDISVPGQYVILMPMNRFFGVSKRITDEAERKQLVALGEEISQGRFGLIMREASLPARKQDVLDEAERLFSEWQALSAGMYCRKAPCVLLREETPFEAALRDLAPKGSIEAFSTLCEDERYRVSEERGEELWRQFRVEEQRKEASGRRIPFPGGGFLVIDEREALQTVDVNSGSYVRTSSGQSLAAEVNQAACREIARQIRLRNLSGIIMIDFIDMASEAEREQVAQTLEAALRSDRVKTVVHGFTRLGLLEMTRKRSGPALSEMLLDGRKDR